MLFYENKNRESALCNVKTKTCAAVSAKALNIQLLSTLLRFGFYDNRDNRDNGLIVTSMLSVDNNKNNFYQPKGWLPLEPTFTFYSRFACN